MVQIRSQNYYDSSKSKNACAKQASAVSEWFFREDTAGKDQLMDVDETLRGMAQSGTIIFMDLFFSLDHLQSNLTRSTFFFEYETSADNDAAFRSFLIDDLVLLAQGSDQDENKDLR